MLRHNKNAANARLESSLGHADMRAWAIRKLAVTRWLKDKIYIYCCFKYLEPFEATHGRENDVVDACPDS